MSISSCDAGGRLWTIEKAGGCFYFGMYDSVGVVDEMQQNGGNFDAGRLRRRGVKVSSDSGAEGRRESRGQEGGA